VHFFLISGLHDAPPERLQEIFDVVAEAGNGLSPVISVVCLPEGALFEKVHQGRCGKYGVVEAARVQQDRGFFQIFDQRHSVAECAKLSEDGLGFLLQ
jgi:hypothetical protein